MKIPDLFVPEKNLEDNIGRLLKESQEPIVAQPKCGKFEVIHADTYAEGLVKLKGQGKKPFTFFDNVEARIINYEINDEGAELFKTWLDSVTGIAYKAHSTKFKLILKSDKLENIIENITKNFDRSFIPIDYDSERGVEFDSSKGKYNKPLTRKEAKNHEFWIAAMNSDKEKLVKYVDIWFDKTGRKEGMGVYLRSNTDKDELRGLALLSDDGSYSNADGYYDLDYGACFVSGAQ